MSEHSIEAQQRTIVGKKVSQLRNQGLVPCTIYGPDIQPVNVQVPHRPLQIALLKSGGTNLIELQVMDKTHTVLAREVQRHVLRGDILHVDFFAVDLKAKVTTNVPVHLIGESEAVTAKRGILLTGATAITIETLPTKLMNSIEIDISKLKDVGDAIMVSDLDLGADVKILSDPEELIARISQTSAARAAEDLEEDELAEGSGEVEVIHKGKDDEEDF